jgi:hypothetical protein
MGPKWQSILNSALFALHVGERWRDAFFCLPQWGRYFLVALTRPRGLLVSARDLFVEANGGPLALRYC